MKKLLFAVALLLPMASYGWTVESLNTTVNQNNFIVDDRCSGTLVSLKHKLVLTAYHCVEHKVTEYKDEEVVDGNLTEVRKLRLLDVPISQKAYSGYEEVGSSSYSTDIVARAEKKDLALLQIKADELPYTVASKFISKDEKLLRGEKVYAVGNPNMLDASVSTGVISSLTRMIRAPWAKNEEIPFIQHDAASTGGSSGGAIYNDDGYLIGVHAAGFRGESLGFAVHPNLVREFMDENCYPVYMGGELKEEAEEGDWYCKDWGERDVFKEDE